MNKLLDEKQVAALLDVSVKALQGWRSRGGGPRFVKFGRLVRYSMPDLEAFVVASQRTSTSDPGRSAAYRLPPSISRVTLPEQTGRSLTSGSSAAPAPRPKPR